MEIQSRGKIVSNYKRSLSLIILYDSPFAYLPSLHLLFMSTDDTDKLVSETRRRVSVELIVLAVASAAANSSSSHALSRAWQQTEVGGDQG